MLQIAVILLCVLALFLLKFFLGVNFKQIKAFETRGSEELEKLAEKFPKEEEICQTILKKLNNENVTIKIEPQYNSCLYTVFNNTITLGKFKQNYMKIQTIAHECIHSCQNKKIAWSNFLFTNLYLLYFSIVCILAFLNKLPYTEIHTLVLIFLSIVQYITRVSLELDAMTKAKYLAQAYIEENKILTKTEEDILLKEYEEVNSIGVPFENYYLISMNLIKIIIYAFAAFI